MARPNKEICKTSSLMIRLSESEKMILKIKAFQEKKSMGEYLRSKILGIENNNKTLSPEYLTENNLLDTNSLQEKYKNVNPFEKTLITPESFYNDRILFLETKIKKLENQILNYGKR